ncbi:MAG: phytoene desaturase family protein, partial [Firmicutes bacterium]|nr:phytoene desaturase family protein [Bacillota bacterium]
MIHAGRARAQSGERRVCVVGGGIAGLTAATLLAAAGANVTLIEQGDAPGGKARAYVRAGYRFNYGPSTFTLVHLFHNVIAAAGLPPHTLTTARLEVNHRNHFADGHSIDSVTDSERMKAEIARLSPRDAEQWQAYLADADRLLGLSGNFFRRALSDRSDYLSPALLSALLRVHPLMTLSALHARHFEDERIRMMLNRYATYIGGRPEATAATLAMIAAIEYRLGVHHISGGGAALVAALEKAARRTGADIRLRARAQRVVHRGGRVVGIIVDDAELPADAVIVTADSAGAGLRVAGDALTGRYRRTLAQLPLSLSGFAMLLGVARGWPHLQHHNVFFPPRYADEFHSIFDHQSLAEAPTIYVGWSGYSESEVAPAGSSNLFVLVNAPALVPGADLPPSAWRSYG